MEISYVAVCTRCGAEFQPHVTTCIDCGGATETRMETPGAAWTPPPRPVPPPPPEPTAFSLPPGAEAAGVFSASLEPALDLAVFLERRGVPCRLDLVDRGKPVAVYAVCVAPADFERALTLQRDHVAEIVPDGELPPEPHPPGSCPACGAAVPAGAVECPECELVVGGAPGEAEDEEEAAAAGE
jgi:hypothetical protein